jgi:hypothetical protein
MAELLIAVVIEALTAAAVFAVGALLRQWLRPA